MKIRKPQKIISIRRGYFIQEEDTLLLEIPFSKEEEKALKARTGIESESLPLFYNSLARAYMEHRRLLEGLESDVKDHFIDHNKAEKTKVENGAYLFSLKTEPTYTLTNHPSLKKGKISLEMLLSVASNLYQLSEKLHNHNLYLGKISLSEIGLKEENVILYSLLTKGNHSKHLYLSNDGYYAKEAKEMNQLTKRHDDYLIAAVLFHFLTRKKPEEINKIKSIKEISEPLFKEIKNALMLENNQLFSEIEAEKERIKERKELYLSVPKEINSASKSFLPKMPALFSKKETGKKNTKRTGKKKDRKLQIALGVVVALLIATKVLNPADVSQNEDPRVSEKASNSEEPTVARGYENDKNNTWNDTEEEENGSQGNDENSKNEEKNGSTNSSESSSTSTSSSAGTSKKTSENNTTSRVSTTRQTSANASSGSTSVSGNIIKKKVENPQSTDGTPYTGKTNGYTSSTQYKKAPTIISGKDVSKSSNNSSSSSTGGIIQGGTTVKTVSNTTLPSTNTEAQVQEPIKTLSNTFNVTPSTLTMKVGDQVTLKPSKTCIFLSKDLDIASVNKGVVSAKATGETIIDCISLTGDVIHLKVTVE